MSGGPIKAGDLVMVTKVAPCCGHHDQIGRVFAVQYVDNDCNFFCCYCKATLEGVRAAATGGFKGALPEGFLSSRLTRIDPLSDPETQHTPEALPHEPQPA